MREPELVVTAQFAPYNCALCTGTTGPFSDTFFEDRAGRKYLCKRCVRTNARVHGFADGKRLEELSDAAALVEVKDAELAAAAERFTELALLLEAEQHRAIALQGTLDSLLEREQTRDHLVESIAQTAAQLARVGLPELVAA